MEKARGIEVSGDERKGKSGSIWGKKWDWLDGGKEEKEKENRLCGDKKKEYWVGERKKGKEEEEERNKDGRLLPPL